MPYDLIRRAGERLSQQPAPLEAPPAAAPEAAPPPPRAAGSIARAYGAEDNPAPAAAPPAEEPVVPLRQAAPRPPRPQAAAGSRVLALDLPRLRRAGMVTPDGDSDRAVVDEFRRIKRPLLVKAFGPERRKRDSHVIMVTSANPGEGKSYVAHNLALSIAGEADAHVLLVDADINHPSTGQRFGFSAEYGLIDILRRDDVDIGDVLLRTDIGKLGILPPGRPDPRATELLASQRMARLIKEIGGRYDDRVIIFDAPPVLAAPEAAVLAMHVGQVLFVVEAEKTSRRDIEDSLAQVECCQDISLVLNKRRKGLAFAGADAT